MLSAFFLFEPFLPSPGLALWTLVSFLLFWAVMTRVAWKPIVNAINQREVDIQESLDAASKARAEMTDLKGESEKLLNEARMERSKMLKEAKETGERLVKEAKESAGKEASKIISSAQVEIENQKKQALVEVKSKAGVMAVDVAEQLLRKELANKEQQKVLAQQLIDEIKLS